MVYSFSQSTTASVFLTNRWQIAFNYFLYFAENIFFYFNVDSCFFLEKNIIMQFIVGNNLFNQIYYRIHTVFYLGIFNLRLGYQASHNIFSLDLIFNLAKFNIATLYSHHPILGNSIKSGLSYNLDYK